MNIKFDALLGKIREDDFSSSTLSLYILKTGNTSPIDLGVNNFTVDTNSLFVNSATHRVGIGTLTPTAKLTLRLDTNNDGIIIDQSTALKQAYVAFMDQGTTKWLMGKQTDNSLFIYDAANSRDALRVNNAGNVLLSPVGGNVGIGTTTPNAQLAVGSTFGAHISGADTGKGVFGSNFAVNSTGQLYIPNTHGSYGYAGISPNWGNIDFYTSSGPTVANTVVTPTPAMRINAAGNVGIGDSNPQAKLSILGNLNFADAPGNSRTDIGFYALTGLRILNKDNTALTLGTSNSERVRIDASGNVGIGTSTPGYKLDVDGGTDNTGAFRVRQHNGGRIMMIDGNGLTFNTTATFGANVWSGTAMVENYNNAGAPTRGGFLFKGIASQTGDAYIYNNSSNVNLFKVTSDGGAYFAGNVGIGINPTAKLHLPAGTTTVAPLKLTSGTNLTTPEDGAFEYNGTTLFFTVGGTRKTVTLV